MCYYTKYSLVEMRGHPRSLHCHLMSNNILGPYIKNTVVWCLRLQGRLLLTDYLESWGMGDFEMILGDVDILADIQT